jgi:hypothetical protein
MLSLSLVETMARNPSHFISKDHPEPEGRGRGVRPSGRAAAEAERLYRLAVPVIQML